MNKLPEPIPCPFCAGLFNKFKPDKISFLRVEKIYFKQKNVFKRIFNLRGAGDYYACLKCDHSTLWWCRVEAILKYDCIDGTWKIVALDEVYETRWDCCTVSGRA